MGSVPVSTLLKLPPSERAELAIALWDSLTDVERAAALALTPDQEAELDRRWEAHLEDPKSAVPWDEVYQRFLGGR